MNPRLSAHLEVAAIRRLAESQGGFAAVLNKGEPDAGTIALVIIGRDTVPALYERMPDLGGNRRFVRTLAQDAEKPNDFSERIARRGERDPDLWLIEVDVADSERFSASLPR